MSRLGVMVLKIATSCFHDQHLALDALSTDQILTVPPVLLDDADLRPLFRDFDLGDLFVLRVRTDCA